MMELVFDFIFEYLVLHCLVNILFLLWRILSIWKRPSLELQIKFDFISTISQMAYIVFDKQGLVKLVISKMMQQDDNCLLS